MAASGGGEVYKLEWTKARSTIQSGISSLLHRDPFLDTVIVCKDGAMTHNKLTVGLVLPDLHHVPVFDSPVEHTILMPDYLVEEIQTMISAFFPASETQMGGSLIPKTEVEMVGEGGQPKHFEHFLGSEPVEGYIGGYRRGGRGRPPLSNSAKMPARFICDYCNKGFYYKSMLTAHEKLHTGGKRETCNVCGAEYSTRQNLKNHMVKYHGADSFTPRKRGRPPIDRGVEGQMQVKRGRGRGGLHHHIGVMSPMQYDDSNSSQGLGAGHYPSIEHHTQRPPSGGAGELINTENFLEQNLSDDGPEITDNEPIEAKEYIEEDLNKDDLGDVPGEVPMKIVPPFRPSWWSDHPAPTSSPESIPGSRDAMQVIPSNMSNRIQGEPSNMSNRIQGEPSIMSNRIQGEPNNMSNRIQGEPSNMSNRIQGEPSNMSNRIQGEPSNMSNRIQGEPSNMSHRVQVEPSNLSNRAQVDPSKLSNRAHVETSNLSNRVHGEPSNFSNRAHGEPSNLSNRVQVEPSNLLNRAHGEPSNFSNRAHGEPSNLSNRAHGEPSNLSNRVQAELSNMSHYASVPDANPPVIGGNPSARQTNSNSYNNCDLSASNSRSEHLPTSSIDSSDSSHEYQDNVTPAY